MAHHYTQYPVNVLELDLSKRSLRLGPDRGRGMSEYKRGC